MKPGKPAVVQVGIEIGVVRAPQTGLAAVEPTHRCRSGDEQPVRVIVAVETN